MNNFPNQRNNFTITDPYFLKVTLYNAIFDVIITSIVFGIIFDLNLTWQKKIQVKIKPKNPLKKSLKKHLEGTLLWAPSLLTKLLRPSAANNCF